MFSRVSLASENSGEVQRHPGKRIYPHELTQSGYGSIAFRHHFAALGRLSFSYTEYGCARLPFHERAPSTEDIFAIGLTLSGSARFICDGARAVCQSGDFTIISPATVSA